MKSWRNPFHESKKIHLGIPQVSYQRTPRKNPEILPGDSSCIPGGKTGQIFGRIAGIIITGIPVGIAEKIQKRITENPQGKNILGRISSV